jgi:excisionase family DNA binding protein
MRARVWSRDEVRALGVTTDLSTAASVLGLGRTKAYELAARGDFPFTVWRVGRRYRVPTAPLLSMLELGRDLSEDMRLEADDSR